MSLPMFEGPSLRIVCTSDTHNEDPTSHVPPGDIFIHAGDIVDRGSTLQDYAAALNWIASLPHKVKILTGGNGDVELDRDSKRYNPEIVALFHSEQIKSQGLIFLDRETRVIGHVRMKQDRKNDTDVDQYITRDIKIYANPLTPEFSGNKYPFTYHQYPDPDAEQAWQTAPTADDGVQIWVTHCPPRGRLDVANMEGFIGCPVLMDKITKAKPLLCVFGHYHYSWGAERMRWGTEEGPATVELLTVSQEKRQAEGLVGPPTRNAFDFSGGAASERVAHGQDTIFINAAWMTQRKRQVEERNHPITVDLAFV